MTKPAEIHHRRSIRLKDYDYSQAGAYFVTLVTFERKFLFGEIMAGNMKRSRLGEIVWDAWFQSEHIRKEIRLFEDEFVVMPNHIHGIIWIVDEARRGACHAPLQMPPQHALLGTHAEDDAHHAEGRGVHHMLRREGRSLGSMVAGFKAGVTSQAKRELNISNVWQRNYYEHIIRDEAEWGKIRDYILTNPPGWEEDDLYRDA
jgi:putative transposase